MKLRPQIMTVSGNYFNFLHPEQSVFTIHDIAHALSNICRFTGHCKHFYSVAQHSVLASYLVPAEHAFATLMHDAAEAFIGDIATPLKQLLPEYKVIEARVEDVVFGAYGLSRHLHDEVKLADMRMLLSEKLDIMDGEVGDWHYLDGVERAPFEIIPVSSAVAKVLFLDRFRELQPLYVKQLSDKVIQARQALKAAPGTATPTQTV